MDKVKMLMVTRDSNDKIVGVRNMSKHGWIITKVNTEFLDTSEVGTMGPRNITANESEIKSSGREFRMLDDDGIVYYHGYNLGDSFAPLDDFGRPNAGCVSIQYKDDNANWFTV